MQRQYPSGIIAHDSASQSGDSPIEQAGPGVTRQFLLDRRIVVYTLENTNRSTVDLWSQTAMSTTREWPADRPYLAMHDLSAKNASPTPYLKARAKEDLKVPPAGGKVRGYLAIILPKTFFAQLAMLFVRQQRAEHFTTQFFFSREEALQWLKQYLTALPGQPAGD